jgi:hypothetical protein
MPQRHPPQKSAFGKRMLGQAGAEALLLFIASLMVVSILAMAVLSRAGQARAEGAESGKIMAASAASMAVSAACSSGLNMSTDLSREGILFSVENGRLHVPYGSGVIEMDGVFLYDATEPS